MVFMDINYLRNSVKGVIWDVDGTLIDSEPLHFEALLSVSRECGFTIDKTRNESMLGLSLERVWEVLSETHDISIPMEEWKNRIIHYYLKNVSFEMARPGVIDCINTIASKEIFQACVSTAERKILDANLTAIGIGKNISFSFGFEDVAETKPAPEPYIKACERLKLPRNQCIAVEDTMVGVESATRAGLYTIAWPNDMSKNQDFSKADVIVNDIWDVPWAELGNDMNKRILK